jgi:hypothetical protein
MDTVMPLRFAILISLALASAGCSDDRPEVGQAPNLDRAEKFRGELFAEVEAGPDTSATADLKPEDFQTLSGTFVLSGQAPQKRAFNVDKDIAVCLPGGGKLLDNALEVNPQNKGLKNVLIYVATISDDWIHESALGDDSEVVFDQKDCLFLDPIFVAQTSQKLIIKNSDPIGHNTKFTPGGANPPKNPLIPGGSFIEYDPVAAVAPFEVSCTIHSWMKANMIFRDNGYYAVSDAEGKFTIPNIPTGVPLPIKIWHPLGTSMRTITLAPAGGAAEKVSLSRGGLTRTFEPGKPAEVQITIDASELK